MYLATTFAVEGVRGRGGCYPATHVTRISQQRMYILRVAPDRSLENHAILAESHLVACQVGLSPRRAYVSDVHSMGATACNDRYLRSVS